MYSPAQANTFVPDELASRIALVSVVCCFGSERVGADSSAACAPLSVQGAAARIDWQIREQAGASQGACELDAGGSTPERHQKMQIGGPSGQIRNQLRIGSRQHLSKVPDLEESMKT
eukprot:6561959-Alexandrium_andersonii.AAC.1